MDEPLDVPERILALLTKNDPEPYNLPSTALLALEAFLAEARDRGEGELHAALGQMLHFGHFLHRKLASPLAATALVRVVLKFGSIEEALGPSSGAAPLDASWRKLIGDQERGLPPAQTDRSGKRLWQLIEPDPVDES